MKMEEMAETERVRIAKVMKKQRADRKRMKERRRRIEERLAANLEMAKKVGERGMRSNIFYLQS